MSSVRASPKYRRVCPRTVQRIAGEEWAKHRRLKRAIKATKSRLHQVYGAYESPVDYERAYRAPDDALAARYAPRLGNRPVRKRTDHRVKSSEGKVDRPHLDDFVTRPHADSAEDAFAMVQVEERI